jgi:hypothetical protein
LFTIFDPGGITEGNLHPATMCQQFIEMNPTWKVAMASIIGGYTRAAYQVLDPIQPGYTDRFLSFISAGNILSRSRPRFPLFDFDEILERTGVVVEFASEARVRAARQPESGPKVSSQEALPLVAALLLAGVDPGEWLNGARHWAAEPELLESVMPNHQSDGARRAPTDLREWIAFVQEAIADLTAHPEGSPNFRVHGILKCHLNDLDAAVCDFWLDVLVDGIDLLAKMADGRGKTTTSMRLAQMSLLLLQRQEQRRSTLEPRYCAIEARHRRLSWFSTNAPSYSEDLKIDATQVDQVFNYGAFAISASTTDLRFFMKSLELAKAGEAANLMWSAALNAVNRQRELLLLVRAFVDQRDIPTDKKEQTAFLLERAAAMYGQALQLHMSASMQGAGDSTWSWAWFQSFGNEKEGVTFNMHRELEAALEVLEPISKRKKGTFPTAQLERLCETISAGADEPCPHC